MPNELQLSDVLSEFARTMLTEFPIQAILDHLVERIVDVLPITAAGVTLISPGIAPRYVASSDESALCYEALQTELGEGPCLAAYREGVAVAVPDLRVDTRFPTFGPRALEEGMMAVFTFPLRAGDDRLGSLDLYRSSPGPLDAVAMDAAQTLADVASAYLLNAQAREDLQNSSDRSLERSLHDPLTGLPNRVLFLERLDHAVLRARRSGKIAAVLFTDLDRFKVVNDLHGHDVGDQLLVAVADRLSGVLRPSDTLARMSGDEFVILCEDLDDAGEADVIAARIGTAVAEPFVLIDVTTEVTASVGIAFSGRGVQLSEQLMRDADTAMYQAKRKGGARHQIIDLREQRLADERSSLEVELRTALKRDELRTNYQPIVDTNDGRVIGVEALLRWAHPSRGMVPPTLLISLAEASGQIGEIGRWVLERACIDRHQWQNGHADEFSIAVNVSALQLMSAGYAASVAKVLSSTGTDPKLVTLEVTESVFAHDGERARVVLSELKRLGVRLALDDFGTGYSSLNYLKRFPIDVVKIDQGFVADVERDPASHAIVGAVVDLAHKLGMTVVAEGVETAEQYQQLAALGSDACQGFYFARPMPAADISTLVHADVPGDMVRLPALAAAGKPY